MRGFLAGVSVGALVAAAGAVVWSLSVPLPKAVEIGNAAPSQSQAPAQNDLLPRQIPGADADLVEAAPAAPDAVASDDLAAVGDIDATSAAKPEVRIELQSDPTPQSNMSDQPAIAPSADAPFTPEPPTEVTADLTQDAAPQVQADPPGPVSSNVVPQPPLTTPLTDVDLPPSPAETPAADPLTSRPVVAPDMPVAELDRPPEASALPALTEPAPAPSAQTRQQTPDAETSDRDAGSGLGSLETQRIADLPQTTAGGTAQADQGPLIGERVRPLTDRDDEAAGPATEVRPPFERNAVPFMPDAEKPLMSIVLLEDATSVGAEALADFPYPLTFAIDPSLPDAKARMSARRAAGFEVMILADLPRGATPQDAETALPVWFDRMPEAMGVFEGVQTGFQGSRPLADHVTAVVGDAGYGLVTQDNGLNTLAKMALRDETPSGVVFRDFDGAGQNPRAMRRFLDQAAFRANQAGAVIMLGRLKPDTVSALIVWGLQDRASRVALVPVSASLKRNLSLVE